MTNTSNNTITVTADLAASPDQIWNAWNDPSSIARWWGPDEFTSTVRELDVRVGGRFDVVMHGPDGSDFANVYVFDAVDPGRRIAYTNQGSEEWGLAPFSSVVDFVPQGAITRATMVCQYADDEEYRKHVEDFHAVEGAQQLLERLGRVAGEPKRG
jgi:uncharacterized protein YndB with AHSA1/START domain